MTTIDTDVLVIGGGPAGIQAARILRTKSPRTSVTVLRPEPHSMIYCALPYAIEGLFPLEATFKSDSLVTDSGARLDRRSAVRVLPAEHRVVLDDGASLGYRKLLIATGARPVRPPVPGVELANVLTLKTAADTRVIMDRLAREGVTAVVVGSGAIGIEQATAYRAMGAAVHLVEMRDHVLPHQLEAATTGPLEAELIDQGITLRLGAGLAALEGVDEVSRVVLADGTAISLCPGRDFVMLAVGMAPDIGLLDPADIALVNDGIVVDERMRTSAPDIWAAGDCASFRSGIDGKPLGGKLATNAVPMAQVAARDMLDIPARYPGFFNGAATVVGRWRVAGTGFTEAFARSRGLDVVATAAQTATRFPMMPGAGDVTVKLVVERATSRLIGGQIVGTEAVAERIDVVTLAIQQRLTAPELAELSYSAQPWQTFFPARNAIVAAAQAAMEMASRAQEVA